MRAGWIALASAVLVLSDAKASQPEPDGLQRCAAAAAGRADFSGAILVSRNGVPVAQVYRGRMAGPESPAIEPNARFNLGSTSKMFTAVAIGQLIEKRKLRLDEPIGEVVNGLTPAAGQVTIRQLLNHTSGLGDFFAPQNMDAMLRARNASDILPLISNDTPAFTPGSRFSYSNSGFALLGIAIERVTGMSYGEYLQRNVFIPAGMTNTGLNPHPLDTLAVGMTAGGMRSTGSGGRQPGIVLLPGSKSWPGGPTAASAPTAGLMLIGPDGRRVDPSGVAAEPQALRPAPGAREGYGSPAGGLFSTATDMNKFAVALLDGKLLSRSTFTQFTSPQVEASPAAAGKPARYYGFGFGLTDDAGQRWIGHNGGTLGANVEFWIAPEGQLSVVVLSNRDPPVATDIMRQVRPLLTAPTTSGCS